MFVRPVFRSLLVLSALMSAGAFAQGVADLAITKSGPSVAAAGSDVPYDISAPNLGPNEASTVDIKDVMPPGMTFVSVIQNSGPAFNCSSVPAVGTNGTVDCTLALFTNGSSADFTFTFHIPPATPQATFFTNTATVSTATFDPNSENDSSSAATSTPSNNADVGVTKNGPTAAAAGGDVVYTIHVVSNGPAVAQSVSLNETLPRTITFVPMVQNTAPAFSCSTPLAGSGGTVTCTIASMAVGASADFTLTGHIPGATSSGTAFSNTASVTSAQDPNPENDSSTITTTVSSADFA